MPPVQKRRMHPGVFFFPNADKHNILKAKHNEPGEKIRALLFYEE